MSEYLEKAIAIHMQIKDKEGEAVARTNQVAVLYSLGEYQRAKEYSEKALAINMEIGHKKGEADARTNLGVVLSSQVNFRRLKNITR